MKKIIVAGIGLLLVGCVQYVPVAAPVAPVVVNPVPVVYYSQPYYNYYYRPYYYNRYYYY